MCNIKKKNRTFSDDRDYSVFSLVLQIKINTFTWTQTFTAATVGYNKKKSEKEKNKIVLEDNKRR